MTSVGLFEAKLEAFEMCIDAKLHDLFEEFILGPSPSPKRSQHGANSDCKKNPPKLRHDGPTLQRHRSPLHNFKKGTSIKMLRVKSMHRVNAIGNSPRVRRDLAEGIRSLPGWCKGVRQKIVGVAEKLVGCCDGLVMDV
ncbi:hypothetical protein BHE74_00029653 [Ensete ventricosum]|uniref:Uncharacterized protein n=1 Tax=Ensete ventricosum TaxID=4639 RepID=A0A444EQL8_ENSVE|nr:hypothetical protein GW17_00023679 [Ensete ventricosum]RWW63186.1 hypothetical protein BHE74_00029653 [Ensete ventricosum]RZR74277.1 hypothetical protein BHM03_00034611 [Ensete ventricosum]